MAGKIEVINMSEKKSFTKEDIIKSFDERFVMRAENVAVALGTYYESLLIDMNNFKGEMRDFREETNNKIDKNHQEIMESLKNIT